MAPKKATAQQALNLKKRLTSAINRNIEETLAAKASAIKPLSILQPLASAGSAKLASNPKAGHSGRAIKGMQKKK